MASKDVGNRGYNNSRIFGMASKGVGGGCRGRASGNGFSRGGMSRGGQGMRGNRSSNNSNKRSTFRGTGNRNRGYRISGMASKGVGNRGYNNSRISGMASKGVGCGSLEMGSVEVACLGVDKACVETDVQIIPIISQVSEELVIETEVIEFLGWPVKVLETEVITTVEFLGWPVKVLEVGVVDEHLEIGSVEVACLGVDKACVET
ncbi:hypothetical protein SNE40_015021 [Patella caerulea]|uniref:Uncharacterized protein n=1 Tax=Patella caerulea TaxID=87958 RepID=A0AAN8PID1_PATCE